MSTEQYHILQHIPQIPQVRVTHVSKEPCRNYWSTIFTGQMAFLTPTYQSMPQQIKKKHKNVLKNNFCNRDDNIIIISSYHIVDLKRQNFCRLRSTIWYDDMMMILRPSHWNKQA